MFEESRRAAEKAFRALVRGEGNQRREIKEAETTLLALAGKKLDATPLTKFGQIMINEEPLIILVGFCRRSSNS